MRTLLLAFVFCPLGATAAGGEDPPAAVVLDTGSFWRIRTVWETVEVVRDSGEVEHVRFVYDHRWFRENEGKVEVERGAYEVEPLPVVRLPERTSPEWMQPEFDDSTWVRLRDPVLAESTNTNWKLVLMRGRFEVTDPAGVERLTLRLKFRGGAVVYLNGREVVRRFMPDGPITVNTPAVPYPEEIYVDDHGFLVWPHDDKDVYEKKAAERIRSIEDCTVPGNLLRKGVNVLAVAVHRAPAPELLYLRRIKRYPEADERMHWCKTGLLEIALRAAPGSAVVPNISAPKDRGFLVWNQSTVRKVFLEEYADPFAPLRAVKLTGVRGGAFAGQVVVGDQKPIAGLKAVASELKGPGAIPASAIDIRYALPDGRPYQRDKLGAFDSLEEEPPAEVPVYEQHGGAVQPIWFTVRVPQNAAPGDYRGTVTVTAEAAPTVDVPIELRVIDWTLPDPNVFAARMDIAESPESLAMAYGVELWSDEHWRLLDKTFALLKPLAVKTLYLTAIRRTHWGNEHAMVRWVRGEDGELSPNFDVVEKYLDVATKHLGAVPGVILYCWEPMSSMGHAGGAGGARRTHDKPILYTLWDPGSGTLKKRTGPAWGTPEAKQFWAKFNRGIAPLLRKRGLEQSMLFGLIGDARPTKQAMDDICSGVPEEAAKWAAHSHYYAVEWEGYDLGMAVSLWGIGCAPVDPAEGRGYGWQNPFWLAYYPREMSMFTSLVEHRVKLERWIGAVSRSETVYSKAKGARGLGRLGADFWKVIPDSRGTLTDSLAGRYPESYWGQLNLNYGIPHLLGKGKNGPVPTVRSEAFRENLQEVEARVFIEKALTDDAKRARLGDDLARRCREALDKRIRMCLHAEGEGLPWFVSSGWSRRTEELFELAAEVAGELER